MEPVKIPVEIFGLCWRSASYVETTLPYCHYDSTPGEVRIKYCDVL